MNPPGESSYSLEITARLTGMSADTILRYQEQGLVSAGPDSGTFDDEALRTLRRIEHLRETCGVNDAGLRLILHLMDEIERLKNG